MAGDAADPLGPARTLLIGVRWGALAVSLVSAAVSDRGSSTALGIGAAAVLAVVTGRTLWPSQLRAGQAVDRLLLFGELGVLTTAAAATGGLDSPLIFSLAGGGVLLGYGLGMVAASAVMSGLVVLFTAGALLSERHEEPQQLVLGANLVLLVTVVAGYARRLSSAEVLKTTQALSRLERLNEANDLLFELYRVAQTLPVSLDLGDTLSLTAARIREIFQPDGIAVLLADDATGLWSTAVAEGVRPRANLERAQLTGPVGDAAAQIDAVVADPLPPGAGLAYGSKAGVYCSLRARGRLMGVLAVERIEMGTFTRKDASLLEGVSEQAALAIDNARWFARLRRTGADQERTRIARELHDRVGQALAYLAFELERLTERADGNELKDELTQLRTDARQAVAEVREALYDLRTDVSESEGLVPVLAEFLDRVGTRSDLEVRFHHEAPARLPVLQEREVLRIAQEAVTNVERHAGASRLDVTWRVERAEAMLQVVDNGDGFRVGRNGRLDSYGLVGMRERAAAIGASLEINSEPSRGTTIRCRIRRPELEASN